jgi:hypothetical protein
MNVVNANVVAEIKILEAKDRTFAEYSLARKLSQKVYKNAHFRLNQSIHAYDHAVVLSQVV